MGCFRRSLEIEPGYREALLNMALIKLRNEDFKEGFRLYEERWGVDSAKDTYIRTKKQKWSGERRKILFVWSEQGIGDVLMFSSILRELLAICERVILRCDYRLVPLFKRSFPRKIDIFENQQCLEPQYLWLWLVCQ